MSIDLHKYMHFYPNKKPGSKTNRASWFKWWQGRGSNSRHLVFQRLVTGFNGVGNFFRPLRITTESRLYLRPPEVWRMSGV